MAQNTATRYTGMAIGLHWLTAALIVILAILAVSLWRLLQ